MRPFVYFALVCALTVPFWIAGANGAELMPGLPVSAFAVVCPTLAASILVFSHGGTKAVKDLLARSGDWRRVKPAVRFVPILLLMPVTYVLSFFIMRALGMPLPQPVFPAVGQIAFLIVLFLVGAASEEIGWSGYALDGLQTRFTPLIASLILGAVWAIWHYVALLEIARPLGWIAGWTVSTIAMRMVMVAIYNNAGRSVFAVTLLHAGNNLCWQLFPNRGSYYDPRVTGAILAATAIGIALFGWFRVPTPIKDATT